MPIEPNPGVGGGPIASTGKLLTGACLSNGNPIAEVYDASLATPVLLGWVNLTTGAFTAGALPPGVKACGGGGLSFELGGALCDILADGTIGGVAWTEIEHDSAGVIVGVRLVDITSPTAATYVPAGTMGRCPSDQIEAVAMCDSGTGALGTPFIRWFAYDSVGAVITRDVSISGAVYAPVGPVFVGPCVTSTEISAACDLAPPTPVEIIRRARSLANGTVTVDYLSLTGAPVATPVDVGSCPGRDLVMDLVCDANAGSPRTLNRLRVVDKNDGLFVFGIVYLLADGSVASPVPAALSLGACVTPTPTRTTELLLDVTPSAAIPFLRRYNTDAAGVVTTTTTLLDGTTVYPVAGAPVAPDSEGNALFILCDYPAAGAPTRFLRRYRVANNAVIDVKTTQLDGVTAYIPTGTVQTCDPARETTVLLCDVTGPGASAQFLRRYTYNGTTTDVANFTLAGATYVPGPTVGLCADRQVTPLQMLDVTAIGAVPFLRHYIFNPADGTVQTSDRTLTGALYPLTGVAVHAEAEEAVSLVACDVAVSGVATSFIRTFRIASGVILSRTDTQMDGTTPYAVAGTVGACPALTGRAQAKQAFIGSGTFVGTGFDADIGPWVAPANLKAFGLSIVRGDDASTVADPNTTPNRCDIAIGGVTRGYSRGQVLAYGDESSTLTGITSVTPVGNSAAIVTWETF